MQDTGLTSASRKSQRHFRKDDDRQLNINTLSDEQLARLASQLNDDDDDAGDIDDDGNRVSRHDLDKLADLVCESTNGAWQRPQALHYMMHNRNGAALVQRLRKALTNTKGHQTRGQDANIGSIR
jgi:hypothetical protein